MPIKILIVDDNRFVRKCLATILGNLADVRVVGEADSGKSAIRLASRLKPDVITMDVIMPEMDGIEATRRILSENQGTKVIALSMFCEGEFVSEMFAAGASGYIFKDKLFEELIRAIRTVAGNEVYVGRQVVWSSSQDSKAPD
jgi:DNA-binding NarL/FixJ family response regulator